MIGIQFDTALIEREMSRMKDVPHAVQRVLQPAVREVLEKTRLDVVAGLQSMLPLEAHMIEDGVKARPTLYTAQGTSGEILVKSRGVALIHYDVQSKRVTARRGVRNKNWQGFTFSLRRGQRRTRDRLLGRYAMRHLPFVARVAGRLGVFFRNPAGELRQAGGPSLQYHAHDPQFEIRIVAKAERHFQLMLPRFVDAALAGGAS